MRWGAKTKTERHQGTPVGFAGSKRRPSQLITGDKTVESVEAGIYQYVPDPHSLHALKSGDSRKIVAEDSRGQHWMAEAPAMILITGEVSRSSAKYGARAGMYMHMEAGAIAQNVFLQAEAMGLGAGIVGAFENQKISQHLGLPASHDPLLILPVGYGR